jgi:transcription elongation GreA/GreB family factor
MTAANLEELRFELEQLRRKSSHHVEKREHTVLGARLGVLEDAITRAVVVDAAPTAPEVVVIGSAVTIEDVDSGARDRYVISAASPMGEALIDAHPGSVVTIELPDGRSRSVRLLSVEPPA